MNTLKRYGGDEEGEIASIQTMEDDELVRWDSR
jgi:hypothetical protein